MRACALRLRDEVKSLQRRLGVTTIMVTHDQEEALAMADRIVVMNQGVIEQVGTPSEIYRNPATAFVADFVGTMTFLDAEVTGPDRLRMGSIDLACNSINGFKHGAMVRIGLRPEEIRVRNIERIDAEPDRHTRLAARFPRLVLPRAARAGGGAGRRDPRRFLRQPDAGS